MSDKSKQNISELMDGELSNDCSRFLIKRMQSDESLQSSWNNYHMLRSCLQQEHDAPVMHNLGAQVIGQLNKEADFTESVETNHKSGWLKSLAGAAIAASVAVVAVFTFNQNQVTPGVEPLPIYAKTSEQLVNPPNAAMVRVEQPVRYTRYPSLTPQIQTYLTESNNQPQIPVYYNAEYANKIIIQTRQKAQQNIAEE
ncbi:sigma-E factor negative regulatory protein [Marinicella sp. S1101]|uniref:sigma-E factor negative regulatory protein n=1 Tax=Marinicella marina TaxID=2996016 RepID=UPI002260CEDB|nr:sigma-E factor negative regulatory protein [Marinicella marina]MCX7555021.1 sigma-E factor negative regulatory protein [Marinicella marina]MDJ1141315.1 sigma-E factor negative regulatory protein [Marinicella marina]